MINWNDNYSHVDNEYRFAILLRQIKQIMKILCPTDLSIQALNAMEYGARLAQQLKASLTFLNVQKIAIGEGVSLFAGGERESAKTLEVFSKVLEDQCKEISLKFNIHCDQVLTTTIGSIENTIAEVSKEFDLIVVGTNGSNNIYEFYFGTHSYNISKTAEVPVLIVPEDFEFTALSRICIASDYTTGEELNLNHLEGMLRVFNPHYEVIHVSENDNEISKTVYHSFRNSIEDEINFIQRISFSRLINDDIVSAIKSLIDKNKMDLMVLSFQKHGPIYKLFHKNLIKEITAYSTKPIFIFHT